MRAKRDVFYKNVEGTEIKYSIYINGWKYLILFSTLFEEKELNLIEELIASRDYDNYLIAKALIDNKNG